jgi:hypothetical protein
MGFEGVARQRGLVGGGVVGLELPRESPGPAAPLALILGGVSGDLDGDRGESGLSMAAAAFLVFSGVKKPLFKPEGVRSAEDGNKDEQNKTKTQTVWQIEPLVGRSRLR